ncbi:MAG: HlyD family efflux transporter periplasmic adaptor subunit [Anaerolineales bacterium]|jgi:multidrug efflux pump subunit AcrA (membrane-fusion protein)
MKHGISMLLLTALALTACGAGANSPTPLPTIVLVGNPTPTPSVQSLGISVTASGIVVPAQETQLAFVTGGNIKTVNVAAGDQVQAGQVLAQLDDTLQSIQLAQDNQTLLELSSPTALATAQKAVAQDQQDLYNAQVALNNLTAQHSNQGLILSAQADLVLAQNNLNQAQKAYNQVPGDPTANANKAYAYEQLYTAQQNYNHAEYMYNLYTGKANQMTIDADTAQVALERAKLAEDQTLVAALSGTQVPENATGPGYAALLQAKLNVQTAQYDLDATRLVAPFSGTVVSVNAVAGEYVAPETIMFVIADVGQLHVETTDLSERDIPRVEVGLQTTVLVNALGQEVPGRVSLISPLADTLGGDVVYKVTVELDKLPPGLRAGMSVEVQFHSKP